jgi:DHA2 family multidrug resistance protein
MFWFPAIATPLMMACIYFGIPQSPKPQSKKEPPSFAGFLYLSAGFALLYAALDQGQRLDWWRSGLFNALIAGAALFLLCSLVERLRRPNFMIDLPYLCNWNTILLGFALFSFRFVFLGTIVIIPQSLSVRGLDPEQFGPAVLWTAVFELALGFIGAALLYKGINSHLLMGIGFTAVAFACLINADFTSAWAAENYYRSELLMGVGQSFAMLGVVSSLILQATFSGALEAPQRILTFSAFVHTVRLLGGQTGAVFLGHFIADREKLHSNLLGLHVQAGNWRTDGSLHGLAAGLAGRSNGVVAAIGRALDIVDSKLRLQAYALTFIDAFHLVVWACVAMLLVTAVLRRSPMNFRQLPALQQGSNSPQGVGREFSTAIGIQCPVSGSDMRRGTERSFVGSADHQSAAGRRAGPGAKSRCSNLILEGRGRRACQGGRSKCVPPSAQERHLIHLRNRHPIYRNRYRLSRFRGAQSNSSARPHS